MSSPKKAVSELKQEETTTPDTAAEDSEPATTSSKIVTFTIDQHTEEVLERLKKRLKKTSRAEVLRKAIALLEVATEAEAEGGGIATVDSRGNVRHIKLV